MKTTAELIYQFSPKYLATIYAGLSPNDCATIKRALEVLYLLENPAQSLGKVLMDIPNISDGRPWDNYREMEEETARRTAKAILSFVDRHGMPG